MALNIVGAGMAGLLAANLLHRHQPVVYEKAKALPNNHSAVLRFRTPTIGEVLNIPFRKVTMIKDIVPYSNNVVADALAYSFKNSGVRRSDRSITAGRVVADRWIAPSDLVSRMATDLKFFFDWDFDFKLPGPTISTIPMPMLMAALDYPQHKRPDFGSRPGLNIKARLKDTDAYVTLMVPNPNIAFSRVSITGNELIVEVPNLISVDENWMKEIAQHNLEEALEILDIQDQDAMSTIKWSMQTYAKIDPIDDDVRKDFIHWATDQHGIFSLGRYATWRPGLLLDDLVQDIQLIERWLSKGRYALARHR